MLDIQDTCGADRCYLSPPYPETNLVNVGNFGRHKTSVIWTYIDLVGATSLANVDGFDEAKKIFVGVNLFGRHKSFGSRQ